MDFFIEVSFWTSNISIFAFATLSCLSIMPINNYKFFWFSFSILKFYYKMFCFVYKESKMISILESQLCNNSNVINFHGIIIFILN
jgi:hypothetical protein